MSFEANDSNHGNHHPHEPVPIQHHAAIDYGMISFTNGRPADEELGERIDLHDAPAEAARLAEKRCTQLRWEYRPPPRM